MSTPRPDLSPEFEIKAVPVDALVRMRAVGRQYADAASVLGLGQGDLVDLAIPPFQRGLKWTRERLTDFHYSLIQGWPVGVMVLAIESSEIINRENNQRRFRLSLIDGQQRSWALSELVGKFWTNPWFAFSSPKWETLGPSSGPIVEAGEALSQLALETNIAQGIIATAINGIARREKRDAFEDYAYLLDLLRDDINDWPHEISKDGRAATRRLSAALVRQEDMLRELPIPVLLLNEVLRNELPTVFRRLNEGVPLKGYDLLAATWSTSPILPLKATKAQRKFLQEVLDVAEDRIADSYSGSEEGYEYDPTLDPLEIGHLSLFDLLYFLSRNIGQRETFAAAKQDVAAFQVAALCFNGQVQKVDENLRQAFPVSEPGQTPDIVVFPGNVMDAAQQVELALKPLMDVTAKNLTSFKGRVGLTPAVVYISVFLTHWFKVSESQPGGPLSIRSRGRSANDRTIRPGLDLSSTERAQLLKARLPAWFVHDALTSVFAGSRAYEAANDRVWRTFAEGTGIGRKRVLNPANTMFASPRLNALLHAFETLWMSELSQTKTPQRRRVSDGGAILLRAAFSDLQVHDTDIDHVIPFALGRQASDLRNTVYPLNHVANQMPLDPTVNSSRQDKPWSTYHVYLKPAQKLQVERCLLVPWELSTSEVLETMGHFVDFLALRFRLLVGRAFHNLSLDEWEGLSPAEREQTLSKVATSRL